MAEIRINATGGVKLYDADDSHYAQIVAGTITSNVDAITLGHNIATFNAAVTATGILKTDDTTEATSTTDGSLQTDGGLSVAKDTVLGDDLKLLSDSSVIAFGADGDTTLTHTDGTGLTLNSTNKLCFNDASQYIQGASNAILDIAATDEIELNATLVDINANVEISGTATTTGVHTFSATPVFPDGSLALADLDIDGGTDIGAAIVDADLFIVDDGAGGTNRKVTASRIKTYAGGASAIGSLDDVTMDIANFTDGILIQPNSDGSAPTTGTLNAANENVGIGVDVFKALTAGDSCVAIGSYALDALTTGDDNVAIGYLAGSGQVGGYGNTYIGYKACETGNGGLNQVAIGQEAGKVSTGAGTIFIGYQAGIANTDGEDNIAIGKNAYDAADGEGNNIAIGKDALGGSVNGGEFNVGIGTQVFENLTSGDHNTAMGYQAGSGLTSGTSNTMYGVSSIGNAAVTGSDNVAVGRNAGYAMTSGDDNVIVGHTAGEALTEGLRNTLIGRSAGDALTTGDNNVIIGKDCASAAVGTDQQIVIGYNVTSVGADNISIGNGNTSRVYNDFSSNATWTRSSDERLKKEIKTNDDCGLDFLNDLRTVTFKWKSPSEQPKEFNSHDPNKTEADHKDKLYGFIAQEVKSVLDKHNITDFNGWNSAADGEDNNIQGISYEMFVVPLVKAVQELSARVKELEDK